MPSLEEWKQKTTKFFQSIDRKQLVTALGVTTFMGLSLFFLKLIRERRSPASQHIQRIYENVAKNMDNSQKSRQPLIIQQQHTFEHMGITMIYTLVSKLKQKQRHNEEQIRNPFLPPFQEGLFIQQLGPSHRLIFNKYNIYQQHLLLVTKEFQHQSTPLNKQDFKQCIYTFKALRGLYFFNSGPKAGASQIHKHIQIFPYEAKDLPMFRNILEFAREIKHKLPYPKHLNPEQFSVIEYPDFNFKHGIVVISSNQNSSQSEYDKSKQEKNRGDLKLSALIEATYKAYQRLYKHLIKAYQGDQLCDYNLFGCEHFMAMIPRKKQKAFNQVSINAVGFMGSTLFKDQQLLRKYVNEDRKAHQLLEDITFANIKKN